MELQSKEDKLTANNKFLLLNLQQLKLLSLQDVRILIIQLQSLWEDRWAGGLSPTSYLKTYFAKLNVFQFSGLKANKQKGS